MKLILAGLFISALCLGLAIGLPDLGCHIVGQEVNADNSIEYMMMGDC